MLQALAERASTEGLTHVFALKLRGSCIHYVSNTSDIGSGFHKEFRSEGSKLMQWKGLILLSVPIFAIRKIFLTFNQNLPRSGFKPITVSPSGNGDQWQSTLQSTTNRSTAFYPSHGCHQENSPHWEDSFTTLVSSAILGYKLYFRKLSYLFNISDFFPYFFYFTYD